jgi:two-component system, LytTR family, sensor kinase
MSPSRSSSVPHYLRWTAVSWVVWTLVLTLDVASFLLARATYPDWVGPLPVSWAILLRTVMWYSWWLWTPAIFYLARRFCFEPGTHIRSFVVHVAAALVIIRVNGAVMTAIRSWMGVSTAIPFVSMSNLVQYAAVCGAAMILDLRRRERAHLLGAARLESELTQSRMRALIAQVRPHFLYNALNGVAMLIRSGAEGKALESVVGYGELLRRTLDADRAEVPLRDELAFVERYLALERMRFADTLSATISSEPGVGDALVPNLVLQPLVENALHHGLSNVEANARLEVIASRHANALRLEVRDNGVGLPADWRLETTTGVGLRSTRSRLRECYGHDHHFELHSQLEGGTAVIIEIPYRTAAVVGVAS